MLEALLVLGCVALLAALGLAAPLVPAEWVVGAGIACTAAGLLLGIPAGLWYHVKLRESLRRRGVLPARWWLRPVAHHGRIPEAERPGVLRWFTLGGIGFAGTVVGCALVVSGVLLQAFRSGAF